MVVLSGRVGTEGERRIADHILTDVLGIQDFTNELVIDPIRRAESPMDIDEHLADEDRDAGLLLGDRPVPLSPEAEHLADRPGRRSGRHDGRAGRRSSAPATWNPPEGPTPEGHVGHGRGAGGLRGAALRATARRRERWTVVG